MRIAVIGTGRMGRGFAQALSPGHEVVIGSRDPDRATAIAKKTGASGGATSGDAVDGADVVFLAVPWRAVPDALPDLGELRGVTLVDMTNPMNQRERDELKKGSAAERIQELVPRARVVKGWNHVHATHLSAPVVDGVASSMLLAADHAGAKKMVAALARDMGFHPVDVGPLRAARDLERLVGVMLFVRLGPFRVLSQP
ncbi:MAG TPA: NADPH-dependent F420 reductase [Actinomycetota bacterium]|nr:NADPH-dependent F420 reductase [Actinomycetota bacterium]